MRSMREGLKKEEWIENVKKGLDLEEVGEMRD